ncbi:hypothetical protein C1H46_041124 [Malus baccata]|uniref:Signal peptidase complex subunit 2 n=1 Tax=Malus baccata TaxID=106549 RepID=A0A540KGK6_MALBA|nr:hypothetical protein C1H46_041124 [Malus baccata]
MQEKKSDSASKNPKKANLLDHHSIKHILDESVTEIVTARGYVEDVRMSNVRLFLGTIIIAIFSSSASLQCAVAADHILQGEECHSLHVSSRCSSSGTRDTVHNQYRVTFNVGAILLGQPIDFKALPSATE